jgi:hypothetical protein
VISDASPGKAGRGFFAHRLSDRFPSDALQAVSSFDQNRVRFSGTFVPVAHLSGGHHDRRERTK